LTRQSINFDLVIPGCAACRDSWREMAAAGNFYRHNYEDVTPRRVWKTLHEDLPPLRASVDQELKRG
jgi:uncharacterized protein with HEPN domain